MGTSPWTLDRISRLESSSTTKDHLAKSSHIFMKVAKVGQISQNNLLRTNLKNCDAHEALHV